jgi:ABC-type transport system substrate-binding protein
MIRDPRPKIRCALPESVCRALVAVACLCLASCASRPPALTYLPGPNAGPPLQGGSIVLVREEDPDFLDPALSYGTYSGPVNEAIYHTLMDYAHVPGPEGARLVPDLADALPTVRENGTLYCMRVRASARFGAPLHRHITAADFKYSIERLFRVSSPGASFYRHIVGAAAVLAGRDSVLPGVIARGDSLYVRLTHRDPVFPSMLAMPFTAPMPAEVAERYRGTQSQHTVATGPYQVAEFVPRRHLVLVRNPDYWGQPGHLDTIEVRFGVTSANAVALIKRGRADGGFFEVPPAEFARLRHDPVWASQIDVADGLNTEYLWFNVHLKPFDDVRVRQAVAWALDRRAILKVYAGKGVVAGEFLPLGMPGAVPLHRYPGPDPERARRLLREAGYPNGFSTTLYGWTVEPGPRELTIIQEQLAEVGIRARLDLGETVGYTSLAGDTTRHVPFGIYGWYADYVDPSNFFDPLLNGHRIIPEYNNNLSLYDDPGFNALLERAMVTEDDSARVAMYRELDRRVMDEVPVVPMIHLLESRMYGLRLGGWYRHATRILKLEDLYLKPTRPPAAAVAARARREG